MLAICGGQTVTRTQEGRVLETARQMDGTGWHGRMVPHINGRLRLQKPPLAYWLSDASFNVFGRETAGVGRIPFALAAWLTAGLNLLIGTRLFGRRVGAISMASLLGTVLISRYGLLAETDVLTMLGVTAATYAYWRAAELSLANRASPKPGGFARAVLWYHASATATAFTILAKGPQALFPLLFLIGLCCLRRSAAPLWHWLRSGAPLTILLLALPWFAYIYATVDVRTILDEIRVASLGGAHTGSFVSYFAYLALDSMPWTPFLVAALIVGVPRLSRDRRLAGLALWALVIFVPLCLAGQKQRHYLVPLMPPLMLFVGWYVDRAIRLVKQRGFVRFVVSATAIVFAAASIGLPIWTTSRHALGSADAATSLVLLAAAVAIFAARRGGIARDAITLAHAGAVAVLMLQNVWVPAHAGVTGRTIRAELTRDFGDRPVRMIGRESLSLMFELHAEPGLLETPEQVASAAAQSPETLFVERVDKGEAGMNLPTLSKRASFTLEGDEVNVFDTVH